jgi:zinc/manganese transport system substrate-binding protein
MRKGIIASFVLLVLVIVASAWYAQGHKTDTASTSHKIQVVAAENFWGSLVSQIGGNKVNVLSVVSDPNADPHEYESNAADARAVATANYVIVNGVGYDTWANKLISASPNSKRVTLNVGNLVGKKDGDNPHLWYNPAYVNDAILKMEQNLIAIDPSDKSYFQAQYKTLQANLAPYQNRIAAMKRQYGGTKVAATEDIFAYLANAAGLDLVSPPAFIEAVAEGNDPPTSSVVQFQQQLQSGQVKVLVYNEQTITPLTDSIKQLATQRNIPIVGVTETIQPPNTSFEVWMNAELLDLQNALNANALGK